MFIIFLFLVLMVAPVRGALAEDAEGVGLSIDNENEEIDAFFEEEESSDPLESMNRIFFQVNDKLYFWILKPVNNVYMAVVPIDFRQCFGNFFDNVAAPVHVVNNLLQGKLADASIDLSRFLINSTVGVLGLGDPALRSFGLEPKPEDFGQTLGVWGLGEGLYLCLPLIGPMTVRDTLGFAGNVVVHPATYVGTTYLDGAAYYSADKVNMLSLNPDLYEDMKRYSLDPYISMRQVYLEYRRNKVLDKEVQNDIINEF
ncbi:MAG: VacJ family lipoprotein [Proteobacteria bacterium]|nr:VacJ family lipoprotein [Pseudomonadota bacterium]MBU1649124.1 VacJ family lipoprotein [Pseudomonadota bacterium]MBU1985601.1 VacJ family lipoprotein [Pseudomonadota bacterium]